MPHGLFALAPQMLSATGHVPRRLRVSVWFSPVHLVGVVIAVNFSLEAVAAVWFVSYCFMLVLYLRHLGQVLEAGVGSLLRPSAQSAVVAALSIGSQGLVVVALGHWGTPALATIPAVFTVGALVWYLVARAMGHPAYEEIARALIAWRRRAAHAGEA